MKKVVLNIPVRADLAGASTDISYYLVKCKADHGSVINIALPVTVRIEAKINSGKGIKLSLPDLGQEISGNFEDLNKQENNNISQIVRHFINLFNIDPNGLEISVTSKGKIPPASGLGTSSTVGVGVIMALAKLYNKPGINVPELNYLVEMSMGILGGKQDYYAAWLGGVNYLTFDGPGFGKVNVKSRFESSSDTYNWLVKDIFVYSSGELRSSGVLNSQMEDQYSREPNLINKIAKNADDLWQSIVKKDENKIAESINRDRELRYHLSDAYYTKNMKIISKVAEKCGYVHRACGAGGGGCLLFYGQKKNHSKLNNALKNFAGSKVYSG